MARRSPFANKALLFVAVTGLLLLCIAPRACADSHKAQRSHRRARGPLITATGVGQVPDGYYQSADGLKAAQLKQALGAIIADHTVFNYGELWYHYENTDVVPGTEKQVFDYYSPTIHYFTGTGAAADGMNKEHACPQSWWGSGALSNAYTDLFNVMPSEVGANSAKSNYPLGIVANATYTNTCMKVGSSARSEYPYPVFEPCDEYKGDFARIYFYVATCYADAAWGSKESVAQTVAFTREAYPTIKPWLLDLLLSWNAQDPVSDWEILRNERVYDEQGNRNPFIDYPQLADYIWGDSTQYAFDLSTAILNGTGSGNGSGIVPGDDPGIDPNPNPGTGDDDDTPIEPVGNVLLSEDFSSITVGNDIDNTGSGTPWPGNANFTEVTSAFQAGGAVKLGSSSKAGRLVTRTLSNAPDAKLLVTIQVKGWSKVEGDLLVSLSGAAEQTVSYTATMSDAYETLQLTFDHCQPNAQLTVATSAKRAFITYLSVEAPDASEAITPLTPDADASPHPRTLACNLLGQPVPPTTRGWVIHDGRLQLR